MCKYKKNVMHASHHQEQQKHDKPPSEKTNQEMMYLCEKADF